MAHAILSYTTLVLGEWEAGIAEGRTALALNPNSAFVMGMLGFALGWGGYRDEAVDQLRRAMRASPHDPLTWAWTHWVGIFQFFSRDFEAALETQRHVVRLRPGFPNAYEYIAGCLAYLGRLGEARGVLESARAQFPEALRLNRQRPWERPEDYALRMEGIRLAAEETA